jgi:hypothetical protein
LSSAGRYEFWAVYSGDANNAGSTSTCGTESVKVNQASPATNTQLKNAGADGQFGGGDDSNLAATVALNTKAYDTATVNEVNPTGNSTVTFYMVGPLSTPFAAGDCTNGTQIGSGAVGSHSNVQTLSSAGRYEFWAVYSGDANNAGSTSTCGTESVTVSKSSPGIGTQVKNAGANGAVGGGDDSDIADDASVTIGTKVFDTATVTGAASPAQTITYYVAGPFTTAFSATNCNSGTSIGTGANSNVQTLSAAGRYEFWAVAAANANNEAATATCGAETVNVSKNKPGIVTQVKKSSDNSNVADGGAVLAGTSVYDTATLSGATANAGGTIKFYYVKQTASTPTCTGGSLIATVTVSGNNTYKSTGVNLTIGGTYEFWAVYSSDPNNEGATSTCGSETVRITTDVGGKTIGFWRNKNGQSIITNYCTPAGHQSLYAYLTQYNPFKDQTSQTCSGIATYVTNVINAATKSKINDPSNVNAMLKAQMLATALNVYFSDSSLGGNKIGAPSPIGGITVDLTKICDMIDSSSGTGTCGGSFHNASAAFGGATSMTVTQMLVFSSNLSNVGGTSWSSPYTNKSIEDLAKDAYDAVNNGVIVVI